MSDTRLQLTLRDLQRQIRNPTVWVMLGGASLILGVSGPFQTFELIPTLPRLGYWALIVVSTYVIGFVMTTYVDHGRGKNAGVAATAVTGAGVGLVVGAWIMVLNWIAFGPVMDGWQDVAAIMAYGVVISMVIIVVLRQVLQARHGVDQPEPKQTIALLDRLPLDKRGTLLSISVQDHYVEVRTSKGTELACPACRCIALIGWRWTR